MANPSITPRAKLTTAALLLIGAGLFANAVLMFFKPAPSFPLDFPLDSKAFAQNVGAGNMLGARGIYMMPAQLGPAAFGCYLIDLDSSTIAIYRTDAQANRFKLMAVRSFKNDRFLEDFNNDSPTPKEVKKLVDQQRQRIELNNPETQPAPEDKKE